MPDGLSVLLSGLPDSLRDELLESFALIERNYREHRWDPNEMDAACVLQMAKWVLAEVIRVFHNVSTVEAQEAVDALSERELTLVWEVDGKTRVLDTGLKISDQTLVLLYSKPGGISETELLHAVEYSSASNYRRDVLRKLHKKRWIEYNQGSGLVRISPLGGSHVETSILAKCA